MASGKAATMRGDKAGRDLAIATQELACDENSS